MASSYQIPQGASDLIPNTSYLCIEAHVKQRSAATDSDRSTVMICGTSNAQRSSR